MLKLNMSFAQQEQKNRFYIVRLKDVFSYAKTCRAIQGRPYFV